MAPGSPSTPLGFCSVPPYRPRSGGNGHRGLDSTALLLPLVTLPPTAHTITGAIWYDLRFVAARPGPTGQRDVLHIAPPRGPGHKDRGARLRRPSQCLTRVSAGGISVSHLSRHAPQPRCAHLRAPVLLGLPRRFLCYPRLEHSRASHSGHPGAERCDPAAERQHRDQMVKLRTGDPEPQQRAAVWSPQHFLQHIHRCQPPTNRPCPFLIVLEPSTDLPLLPALPQASPRA